MTTVPISDGDPKNTYTAAAGQTTFAYTFWIKENDHLAVYVNGVLKTLTSDYTVSAVQSTSGANVVFNSGLSLNDSVVIVYDPDFERTAEYTGTIRLEALNIELTYLLTLLQSNQRKIDDAIHFADTETASLNATLPALTGKALSVLRLNATENGIEFGPTTANLDTLATITGDITTVAGIASNVTTVAGNAANITTVAGISSNVTTVAGIASNVTTVAGISANVTSVAGIASDVTVVAGSITDVNTFANRYRIGSSDPVSSLDEGDLFFNTTDNVLKYYNGSTWESISPGLTDIVADTTPQLGGDLDVNGNSIVSASNGNISITPNGTGDVILGNHRFDSDQTVGAGQDNYVMTYDNNTGKVSLEEVAGGDLVSTNNLSDVDNAATSFNNIKQNSTTSSSGVVEKATAAEALAETSDKNITADNAKYLPGTAKAWVHFRGTTSPLFIYDDYNVSSVTDLGTGNYQINFSSNLANANYAVAGICRGTSSSWPFNLAPRMHPTVSPTTSNVRIVTGNVSNGYQYTDGDRISIVIHGD